MPPELPLPPELPPPPLEPPRPPRELVPREPELRERLELLRELDPALRDDLAAAPLRDDFAAPLLAERFEAVPDDALRVPDERLDPLPAALALDDEAEDFLAVPDEREDAEPELREDPPLDRLAVERDPDDEDFRAPPEREFAPPELVEPVLPPDSVGDHFPDITRCAASATASAIREPSFVALETTLLAARSAVSAASSPASRIFFRAAGLALIAAAAAARPAASISLLIAAFASLSTVV